MGEVTVALTRGVSPPKTSMALPVTVTVTAPPSTEASTTTSVRPEPARLCA